MSSANPPKVNLYRAAAWPVAKVFFMGSIVYLSLHRLWWHLELEDMKKIKLAEIRDLEHEVETLQKQQLEMTPEAPSLNGEFSANAQSQASTKWALSRLIWRR